MKSKNNKEYKFHNTQLNRIPRINPYPSFRCDECLLSSDCSFLEYNEHNNPHCLGVFGTDLYDDEAYLEEDD